MRLAMLSLVTFGVGCAYEVEIEAPPDTSTAEDCVEGHAEPPVGAPLGTYETNFGSIATWTKHSYSERGIEYDDDFTIAIIDWGGDHFIGVTAHGYTRVVWQVEDGVPWLCFEVVGSPTLEQARGEVPEVPTDPSDFEAGCGGFLWTKLGGGQ